MARLNAGELPTPHKERLKAYRQELVRSGGKRLVVDLEADGAAALHAIQARDGSTIKEAVTGALIKAAGAKRG